MPKEQILVTTDRRNQTNLKAKWYLLHLSILQQSGYIINNTLV